MNKLKIWSANKANQHRSLRSLDSFAFATFAHGFAIIAQIPQTLSCRSWQRELHRLIRKILVNTLLVFMLFGCATSDPVRLERSKQYEEQAQQANRRAGTPDNIEYMERAYEDSAYYRKKATDEKYKNTWGEFFWSLIGVMVLIAIEQT